MSYVCVCVRGIVPDVGISSGKVFQEKLVLLLIDVDLGCQEHNLWLFGTPVCMFQVVFTDGQGHDCFSTS